MVVFRLVRQIVVVLLEVRDLRLSLVLFLLIFQFFRFHFLINHTPKVLARFGDYTVRLLLLAVDLENSGTGFEIAN